MGDLAATMRRKIQEDSRSMAKKQLQRILVVVFGLAFVGSTGVAIVSGLLRRDGNNQSAAIPETASVQEQLQSQARGYAKVLEREPENPTALEGLLQTSLLSGNLEAAIPAVETLIRLYPERTEYQELLTEINIRLAQESQPAAIPETEE